MKKRLIPFLLTLFIMVSCNGLNNYATDEAFIVVSIHSAGPDLAQNMYESILAINQEGVVLLYTNETDSEYLKIGPDEPKFEKEISPTLVREIEQTIEKSKFWKLKENLSDNSSSDGSYHYITVNLIDKTKTVGGLNPNESEFQAIEKAVFDLVSDEEYQAWQEEIETYIWEKNPE